ncbi:MAG: prolyl-tRNA synthetase associated domain-containing protein [Nanoarchaeota archaeon]
MNDKLIKEYLKKLSIEFKIHKHPPIYTCEEGERFRKSLKGMHAKSLFLKGKKSGNLYLIVLPCKKTINMIKLKETLSEKKLSFANETELFDFLKVKTGSISPFALINDKNKKIKVILDREVYDDKIVNFHPNINTETLELSQESFRKYLDSLENEVNVIEI